MPDERAQASRIVTYSLIGLCVLVLVLAFLVFRPFLLTFTIAASVTLLLAPTHRRLSRGLRDRPTVAAVLVVLAVTLVILLPVAGYGLLLAEQLGGVLAWLRPRFQPDELRGLWSENLLERYPALRDWLPFDDATLSQFVSRGLSAALATANALLQRTLAGLAFTVLHTILFLFMLFFLLRDGPRLARELRRVSPVPEAREQEILEHLARTVKGVLQAMVLVPLAQGLVSVPGFLLVGLPAPILWGVATVFAAFIPGFGATLVWLPASVYLYLSGARLGGVGLFLYGLLVISTIDNIIKPLLLREAARIHPLLGFLAILGGVLAFGAAGFLAGPVILSLVLSAVRIYRLEVLGQGAAAAAPAGPPDPAKPAPAG